MTIKEKQAIINAPCIAYFSGWNGIEIKRIEYGADDSIVFVSGAWAGKKGVHRSTVRYTLGGSPYFMYAGRRIPLNECIRCSC